MSTENRVRASDAEREQVVQVLRAAMTEGRLSLAEGEERMAAVYAATFRDELTPLVADLPGGGWRALRETPEARATLFRHTRCRFVAAAVVTAALLGLWALTGGHVFWPIVIVLLILAFGRRGRRHWEHHAPRYGPPPWARERSHQSR